ncbi:MAG: PEP/pyruvate-binding domain-containing protein [Candidatus Omnitrophica bacterium]|nr:PEP/pyruvate-binding domain-containing protein [Candidatus Omnitrophota bacterium]
MISTGIKGLDNILTGLRKGDNVVWQVDDIREYEDFVAPFVKKALEEDKNVIYMRFAPHKPLLRKSPRIKMYKLDAESGFETFTTQVNKIITKEGDGAYYVFDCLSHLLTAWATDLMVGNFFMVTCPYLYELNTFTYFSLLRNRHSFKTIARIRETTQLLLDVYRSANTNYVHPLKVWNRYSPTMFLPHMMDGDNFVPITDSAHAAKLLSYITEKGAESATRKLDHWDRLFIRAEELAKEPLQKEANSMRRHLYRIMVTRDKRIKALAEDHISLHDLLAIKARLIGTGLIGGKAVGMLLSRRILLKDTSLSWAKLSEPHDSFYIGSDVFYTYIVQNGWWKLRMHQKTEEGYFEAARLLREKMARGMFPEEIMEKFQQMIEYFGTSPIIVRSSSLLEDGFGNAFAGKYESVFCPNQGPPEQRYLQFAEAVRTVYASTMSDEALNYRLRRGLDKRDEQMALLVQRVSGSYHKDYFFPDLAGVGISYNTYVWNEKMNSKMGMARLVFGLGTRAVNRVEGDYARVVALDEPLLKPYSTAEDQRKFSQHDVDVINVKENRYQSIPFTDMMNEGISISVENIGVRDDEVSRMMEGRGAKNKDYWVLNFDELFAKSRFLYIIKKALKSLERAYRYPVDIEFTVNFTRGGMFKINLLQCRPLQTSGLGKKVTIPDSVKKEKILFESKGYFLGGNVSQPIARVVYVDPHAYIKAKMTDKYEVARIVGNLNKLIREKEDMPTLLLGPGRWGTSTPTLGVPVSFFEINNMTVLSEIAFPGGNLMPELSFGTHFFQDLVETGIFYVALFPQKENVFFNDKMLRGSKNILTKLFPGSGKYKDTVGVFDTADTGLKIMSDIVTQKVICFLNK